MKQGRLTAQASRSLSAKLQGCDCQVLFDHGNRQIDPPSQLGQIASWFGSHLAAATRLALLDIAVVCQHTDQALLLVEIEESAVSPKVILGDVFATLLGDHVTFQGKRELHVGPWTILIVLVQGENVQGDARINYLLEKCRELRPLLPSANSSIGEVIIETFCGTADLEHRLLRYADESLANRKGEDKAYCVYILSCAGGGFYTGMTNDLDRRLQEHRSGHGSKWVAQRLPTKVAFCLDGLTREDAREMERYIKTLSRARKQALIDGDARALALIEKRRNW